MSSSYVPLPFTIYLLLFICYLPQLQRFGLRKTHFHIFYFFIEAEFQALQWLHTFLSYGVSLSGIWKYEREIQKVEKYPLWKEYLRPFQFPCESRCYDPTPRREDSPHGGVLKSLNCGRNKELTLSKQLLNSQCQHTTPLTMNTPWM